METEIRATFSRLSRLTAASNRGGAASTGTPGSDRPPTVRLLPLMSALRPLLVRDGAVLVRAAANVLRSADGAPAANGGGASAAGGAGGRNAMVTLAPPHGSGLHHQQQVWVRVWVRVRVRVYVWTVCVVLCACTRKKRVACCEEGCCVVVATTVKGVLCSVSDAPRVSQRTESDVCVCACVCVSS